MKQSLEQQLKDVIVTVPDFPQKGIQFKDITGIFQDVELSEQVIDYFAKEAKGKVDAVCGIESRGFIFGFPIALKLGVPFILIRKEGKLPPPTKGISYQLEYGQSVLEVIERQIEPQMRILIHDDVLATGGTAKAASDLVESLGAVVTQYSFILELDSLNGRDRLEPTEIVSLVHYD